MNQAFIFTERPHWCEKTPGLIWPAMCQGALIECVIEHSWWLSKVEQFNARQWPQAFEQYQFDIEEELTAQAELEAFDEQGRLKLT